MLMHFCSQNELASGEWTSVLLSRDFQDAGTRRWSQK